MNVTLNGTRRWTDAEMRNAIRAHMDERGLDIPALARRMGASSDKIATWLDGQPAFTNFRGRLIGYLDSLGLPRPAAEIAPPSDERVAAAVAKWGRPIYEDDASEAEIGADSSEDKLPAPRSIVTLDRDEGFGPIVDEIRKEFKTVDDAYRRIQHIEHRRTRLIDAYAALTGHDCNVDRELIASEIAQKAGR